MKNSLRLLSCALWLAAIAAGPARAQGTAGAAGWTLDKLIQSLKGLQKFSSVNYLVDPELRNADSAAYQSIRGLNEAFFKATDGSTVPKAWETIRDTLGLFFGKVSNNSPDSHENLKSFLQKGLLLDSVETLTAVKLSFQIAAPKIAVAAVGSTAGAAPAEPAVECSIEFRVFALKKSQTPGREQQDASISRCQLLFQDTSTARISQADLKTRPEEALQSVILGALAGGLARNYCFDDRLKGSFDDKLSGKGLIGPALMSY